MPLKQKSLKYMDSSIFIIIWVVVFLSPLIVEEGVQNINWDLLFNNWIRLLPFLALSIVNHFVLAPYFFFGRKKRGYFFSVALLIVSFSYIVISTTNDKQLPHEMAMNNRMEFQRQHGIPFYSGGTPQSNLPPYIKEKEEITLNKRPLPAAALPPKLSIFLVSILVVGFDTGLMTIFKWNESEQERVKLQKDNINTQLAFLRNQVSPHFFMNTLNNIHSLIDIHTEEDKDSVIRLSKLMRHLLYDSEKEYISLEKEVDFIKNYIDLMRLRFTNKVKIELNIPEQLPTCTIPPLLFTSYLENAFKHGISYQSESFIKVSVKTSANEISFSISNSNPKIKVSDLSSGIGLINSQKRLDLLYNKNYSLNINDETDTFTVNLSIPLC